MNPVLNNFEQHGEPFTAQQVYVRLTVLRCSKGAVLCEYKCTTSGLCKLHGVVVIFVITELYLVYLIIKCFTECF